MALSANSIIHYTSEIEILLNILKSKGFRFSYCSEKITTRGGKSFSAAIAMVSFCDIPLSDYKKHFYNKKNTGDLGYYGDYGIGLNKVWARKNGLNPVFYIEYNSKVSTSLRKDFESFNRVREQISVEPNHPILYAKNYEGELFRGGKRVKKDYRYYDEREWRLVPDYTQINQAIVLDDVRYQRRKEFFKSTMQQSLLSFDLSDISYIIVKTENEVIRIYETLSRVFEKEIERLTPIRVLTSEQIISDF